MVENSLNVVTMDPNDNKNTSSLLIFNSADFYYNAKIHDEETNSNAVSAVAYRDRKRRVTAKDVNHNVNFTGER